jgi:hypothetical protein
MQLQFCKWVWDQHNVDELGVTCGSVFNAYSSHWWTQIMLMLSINFSINIWAGIGGRGLLYFLTGWLFSDIVNLLKASLLGLLEDTAVLKFQCIVAKIPGSGWMRYTIVTVTHPCFGFFIYCTIWQWHKFLFMLYRKSRHSIFLKYCKTLNNNNVMWQVKIVCVKSRIEGEFCDVAKQHAAFRISLEMLQLEIQECVVFISRLISVMNV